MVIILAVTSSSPAISQSEVQSWIKRRLTKNAGTSWYPDSAVSGNNVHVVWVDRTPGNSEIFYKRSSNNGTTWGKQKRLTRNKGWSWSPSIAVSGSNIHVVWQDDTSGNEEIYYKRSTNNGVTWSKQKRLTRNAGDSRNPAIAVSGSDVHVVWYDPSPGNYEILYKQSKDNGATWGKQKRLTNEASYSAEPAIAVSGNNLHVVWVDSAPKAFEIFYMRSTDNGENWSEWERLTYNSGYSDFPAIAVSGSNIHVIWCDETPGNYDIYFKRSSDNGASWRTTKRLSRNAGTSYIPDIASSSNNVYVVWEDSTPGKTQIFYKRSNNNGATWGKQKRLTSISEISRYPAVAASGGNVHVVWSGSPSDIFYKRGP
jgi:hypothetical protein